jgi:hypothetical protein
LYNGYHEKDDPNLFFKTMFLFIWHILATFGCHDSVPLERNGSINNEWFSLIQQKVSIFAENNSSNWLTVFQELTLSNGS